MSSPHTTKLLAVGNNEIVEAILLDEVEPLTLIKAHLEWQPVRLEAAKRCLETGTKFPEHWHWDWSRKANKLELLAYRCFGIECDGHIQGLMMVSTIAQQARIIEEAGKPVLYIEYIESAPWNLRDMVEKPAFSGVGVALMEAAIQFSIAEGFGGRIGLHSLPQSAAFYSRHMKDLGIDLRHLERLRYFEMSPQHAQIFLEGRKT